MPTNPESTGWKLEVSSTPISKVEPEEKGLAGGSLLEVIIRNVR